MAGVRPLCCWATPAERSGYGEGKPPDRCHSACTYRSDRTATHHAHHRDRYRRRCSFSYQGRRLAAHVQRHCYQVQQDRHRSSSTEHPTGSEDNRTPRPAGIFRQSGSFLHQPVMQGYQQRLTSGSPGCQPLSCREAAYFLFHRVQFTDTFQGFLCRRCLSGYINVVDFSTRMGPACRFG